MKKTLKLTACCLITSLICFTACEDQSEQILPSSVTIKDDVSNSNMKNHNLPLAAHVLFGDEDAGSPFPPPEEHDQSIHAKDKMVPRTVVIRQGGAVHYEVSPFHQVAIYKPGTAPKDIDLSLTDDLTSPIFIPDFIINDPNDRVALSPSLAPVEFTWITPAGTFDAPGRYLVICTTFPHFVVADMYGWVIVK